MNPELEDAESLQHLLVSRATGGAPDPVGYKRLRAQLLSQAHLTAYVPRWISTCRDLDQFWQFIKYDHGGYQERKRFIYAEFQPLLAVLERGNSPAHVVVSEALERFDAEHVQTAWAKALERRAEDPEGAITAARTLLESVLKHILDESSSDYEDGSDLNKLYRQAAEVLNIAPSQHTKQVFKQILGGCTAVVEGLGALRNRLSDAHGKGKAAARPSSRHAELAVNLAGSMAMFLFSTFEARNKAGGP